MAAFSMPCSIAVSPDAFAMIPSITDQIMTAPLPELASRYLVCPSNRKLAAKVQTAVKGMDLKPCGTTSGCTC